MFVERAKTLREIRYVTDPTPLKGEFLEKFYVPTDAARDTSYPPTSVLRDRLYEATSHLRLLFASHPGAGKSTELNRLINETQNDFLFIYFSIREELDTATLTHVDLILALMEQLYRQGMEKKLIKNKDIIEPVRSWFSEIIKESKISREETVTMETGVGLNGMLAQIIGLMASVRALFSLSYEAAENIRQVLKPRITDLRNYCNQVIAEIATNLEQEIPRKRLVVIVDDTDKLDIDVARSLFVNHTGLLADLQVSIIYTVPLFLIHSPDRPRLESYFDTLTLPMIKTYKMDNQRFDDGWHILRQIIENRINLNLISPAALELVINKTGGVLRDLLRVIRTASEIARYVQTEQITEESMRNSLDRLKGIYRNSIYGRGSVTTEDLYKKMQEIVIAPNGQAPLDLALQQLLYTQVVIEYNGRSWYSLHPLVHEALQEMGMLT